MFGIFFLPRSPRWLIQKARKKEAHAVLQMLRNRDDLQHESHEIEESARHPRVKFSEIFNRRHAPLILLAFSLFVFQQLSGINTVLYDVATLIRTENLQ